MSQCASQQPGSKKVVELFYDVVSPYTWLAFEVLCRYRGVWNIELKLRPASLKGVMQIAGNKPPGMVPNKFQYMEKDLQRLSLYFAVPIVKPSDVFTVMHVKGSVAAMQFLIALKEMETDGDAKLERVSRELWMRMWNRDEDVTLPESFKEAALKAGLSSEEVEKLLKLSESQPIKDKLDSATKEAMEHGAFGFPLTICHVDGKAEPFFGSDRFELMANIIGEKWLGPQPAIPAVNI